MDVHPIADRLPMAAADDPAERLASLFDTHYDRLYRLARRLVPSIDDALDLVQETFLRAARAPNLVPLGNTGEEAWLVRVLVNIRRDQWRKAGVRKQNDPTANEGFAMIRPRSDPETALIAKATAWQALDQLPPRRRAIVVMHEFEGMPVPAIAALLGIRAVTVRWHLAAGLRELSRTLKPHLGNSNENS